MLIFTVCDEGSHYFKIAKSRNVDFLFPGLLHAGLLPVPGNADAGFRFFADQAIECKPMGAIVGLVLPFHPDVFAFMGC